MVSSPPWPYPANVSEPVLSPFSEAWLAAALVGEVVSESAAVIESMLVSMLVE